MKIIIGLIITAVILFIILRFKKAPSDRNTPNKNEELLEYLDDSKLIEKAFKNFTAKSYEAAITDLDVIIDENKNITKEAFDIRAMSLENLGYYLDTIDDFNQSLSIDPNDANIYYLRGLAKQKIGEYTEAKKDLETAVEMKPNMQQYQQMLHMLETLTKISSMEEMAKQKTKEEGKLKRRIRTKNKTEPQEPNQEDFRKGILASLNNLRAQVKADPNNEELKKLLQENEKRYRKEFVYKKK